MSLKIIKGDYFYEQEKMDNYCDSFGCYGISYAISYCVFSKGKLVFGGKAYKEGV